MKWWSRGVLFLRVLAILFAGVVGLLTLLDYYEFISLAPRFEPTAWAISLAIIAGDNIGTLISRGVHAKLGRRNERIEKALMSLLINLSSKSRSLRFEELGASVYVPSWFDRVRGRRHDQLRLKRIVRFRPAGYPQQSGVSWTPTKGVVGECWRTRKTQPKEWKAIADRYGGAEITREQFEQIPEATRHGFSYEEFVSIVGKYSELLAEPIWHGGKDRVLVGVLSIDRANDPGHSGFRAQLGKRETLEVAAATASTVGDILKPSSADR